MIGAKLEAYFPDEAARLRLLGRPNQPIEAELRHARRVDQFRSS